MKPFLGIDISVDGKNELMHGDEFISDKASDVTRAALKEARAEAEKYTVRARLPLALRIINYALGFGAAFIILGILRAFSDSEGNLTLKTAYSNAPCLFWIGGALALAFIAVTAAAAIRKHRILSSEEARGAMIRLGMATDTAKSELATPACTPAVDVLTFKYKLGKNGKICPKAPDFATSPYFALEMYAYVENGEFRLADCEQTWAFPLDKITGIARVNDSIVISNRGWETIKQHQANLKDFKMSTGDLGLNSKPYYILKINRLGEEYGIYFPCYSIPAVKELVGIEPLNDGENNAEEDSNTIEGKSERENR